MGEPLRKGELARARIQDAIAAHLEEYHHPPTVRQIVARVGASGPSVVWYDLTELVMDGRVRRCKCGCKSYWLEAS